MFVIAVFGPVQQLRGAFSLMRPHVGFRAQSSDRELVHSCRRAGVAIVLLGLGTRNYEARFPSPRLPRCTAKRHITLDAVSEPEPPFLSHWFVSAARSHRSRAKAEWPASAIIRGIPLPSQSKRSPKFSSSALSPSPGLPPGPMTLAGAPKACARGFFPRRFRGSSRSLTLQKSLRSGSSASLRPVGSGLPPAVIAVRHRRRMGRRRVEKGERYDCDWICRQTG